MYNIILQENLETDFGTMKKGDIINTVHYDNVADVKEFIAVNYLLDGIKVSYKRV